MARNDVEQIQFDLGLRTDKFSKSLRDVDKQMSKITKRDFAMKGLQAKDLGKFRKEVKSSVKDVNVLQKKITEGSKKHGKILAKEFKDYKTHHGKIQKLVSKHTKILEGIRKGGDKDRIKDAEKTAAAEIRIAKNALRGQQNILQNKIRSSGGLRVVKGMQKKNEKVEEFRRSVDDFRWGKMGEEVGEGFRDALGSLGAKDLAGAAKGFFSAGGRLLKGTGMGLMKFAQDRKGESGAMGGIAKVIGKMAPSIEGMVRAVSSLGPLLSIAGSVMVGLVKLFIDVDAKAKEVNKELMDGASLAESFSGQGYNAVASYSNLSDVLQTVKDQAFDIGMNLSMGTNAKDHLAIINVLKKEGLTIDGGPNSLVGRLKKAQQASRETAGGMQTFADVTKMSIGYARLFGVSLDEISSLESEMMTQMGSSLKETKLEFSRMTDAAVESGIASNKFFAILRGVSTDLGLYGVRLGEVTKMLKQLGKVMSPKMAQRFLGEFAKGMTEFSTDDRLKMVLLGGPGAVKDITDSLTKQKNELIQKIAGETGLGVADAETLLQGGTVGGKDLKSYNVSDVGTKKEAYMDVMRGLKSATTQGVYGAAQGSKYLDGFSAYEVKKKAALGLSGKSTLEDSIGIRGEKSAEAAGLGGEKFDALLGMERAIDAQRKDLVNAFKAGPNATPEQVKMLNLAKKAGMTDEQIAKGSADDRTVWNSMQDDDADAAKHADEQLKAAYESGKLSQSMLDKMDVVIDGIFNWLYKVLNSIWDTIVDIFGNGDTKAERDFQKSARQSKDPLIAKILGSSGDRYDFRTKMANNLGGTLAGANKEYENLKGQADSPEKKKRMQELLKAKNETYGQAMKASSQGEQIDALGMSTGNADADAKFKKIQAYMLRANAPNADGTTNAPVGIEGAMTGTGVTLTAEEQNMLIEKIVHAMDPTKVLNSNIGGSYAKLGYGGAASVEGVNATAKGAPAPGTPSVSAGPGAISPKAPEPPVTADQGDKTIAAVETISTDLTTKGIKLDKPFLNGPFDKTMRNSVLEALRQALWEYYLYQDVDKSKMLDWVKTQNLGVGDGSGIAQANNAFFDKHASGTGPMIGKDALGRAKFAPSEAPTSIGLGEKIVRDGGGGNYSATVNIQGFTTSDFTSYMTNLVNEGIYKYKLRELRKK